MTLNNKRKNVLNNMCNNYPDIPISVFQFMLELIEKQDKKFLKELKENINFKHTKFEKEYIEETIHKIIDKLAGEELIWYTIEERNALCVGK